MKIRLLSTVICAAMVSTMVMGCSSGASAPATTAAAAAAPETEVKDTTAGDTETAKADAAVDYSDVTVEIVAKGFQHDFWKAVKMGSEQAAEDLGLKSTNFVGPASESAVAEQIEQLNNAVNKAPSAICLAALDTQAALDAISNAQAANIPIVGFDSGVPDAPAGAIVANAATDNYAAGGLAAEKLYEMIKDKVTLVLELIHIVQ